MEGNAAIAYNMLQVCSSRLHYFPLFCTNKQILLNIVV